MSRKRRSQTLGAKVKSREGNSPERGEGPKELFNSQRRSDHEDLK